MDQFQFRAIEFIIPHCYQLAYKKTLKADPLVVNLREKNQNYYIFGMKLKEQIQDKKMMFTLAEVFLARIISVLKLSQFNKVY